MPRQIASTALLARVRSWLGLSQADLALYLGVSQSLLQAIESGPSAPVSVALGPLLHQLPPPEVVLAPPTGRKYPKAGIALPVPSGNFAFLALPDPGLIRFLPSFSFF
ncbi:helix-turn-helix domain-containing protein [Hymenobacter sp. B81]|uniref:helix-turn-helix domain-containing protein n=1 Tax=Hymenobacter sp. B81 TaxID=3344878 RepID=UPI0037DCE226